MFRKRLKGAAKVLDVIRHDPSRDQAFWFLHANHDEILAQSRVGRIPWRAVLAKLRALGLTNGAGNLVTKTGRLRKTWSRVCDLKRREAEAKRQRVAGHWSTNDPPPLDEALAQTIAAGRAAFRTRFEAHRQQQPQARGEAARDLVARWERLLAAYSAALPKLEADPAFDGTHAQLAQFGRGVREQPGGARSAAQPNRDACAGAGTGAGGGASAPTTWDAPDA